MLYERTITNQIGTSDDHSKIRHLGRFLAEAQDISDASTRRSDWIRSQEDSTGSTETIPRYVSFFRSQEDNSGITDTFIRVGTFFRSLLPTVGITDTYQRIGTFFRSLLNFADIDDLMLKSVKNVRSFADSIASSDAVTYGINLVHEFYTFFVGDNVGVSDESSHSTFLRRLTLEFVRVKEDLDGFAYRIINYVRSVADSVQSTDAVLSSKAFVRAVLDTVTSTDQLLQLIVWTWREIQKFVIGIFGEPTAKIQPFILGSKNYIKQSKYSLKSLISITDLDVASAQFKYIDPAGTTGNFGQVFLSKTNDYVFYNTTVDDITIPGVWSIWCEYTDSKGDVIRGDTSKITFHDNEQ